MSTAEDARAAVHNLTPDQARAALMCVWVQNPTLFFKALDAAAQKEQGSG